LKRVAFCTFGCRLNQYDTEAMRALLLEQGDWCAVPFDESADVYVVNTCSVTSTADAHARKMIRRIHGRSPEAQIVATGCYAQRAPEELADLPGVSLVLGAADRVRAPQEISQIVPGEIRMAVSPIAEATVFHEVAITEMMDRSRAFVKVQEGCNETCTFCIVPQTRGASRSRRPENVLAQVRDLVAAGYTEIILTGVHVGDFGLDLAERRRLLPPLIRDILAIDGLDRFRLSSIEPSTVTDELIELAASEEKFARHFHIPMQSGSDDVLARMQRRYTADAYAELVHGIAERVPDCGIGADVMAGFPGESEDDFRQTFDRLVELPLTYLHAFTYSARPGSAAEGFADDVPGDVRKRRTAALRKLSRDKSRAFRERLVGKVMPIVVEGMRRNGDARLGGLTENYVRVDLGPGSTDDNVVNARLLALSDEGLVGELVH
jgi:threonylcarbamoyladenosine tRNA methylthiotransferase MtaB